MALIRRDLIEKIDHAKERLDKSKIPSAITQIFGSLEDTIAENASQLDKDNSDQGLIVVNRFKQAWEYAEKNFSGEVDNIFLSDVAGILQPSLCKPGTNYADWRETSARLKSTRYLAPIGRSKILTSLDRMRAADRETGMHPIERAAYYYFHITRIQPFENGNKRLANISMNSILQSTGFLPIIIPKKDFENFKGYMEGAFEGFIDGGSEVGPEGALEPYKVIDYRQMQFFEFFARTQLNALTCAENRMQGLQKYRVNSGYEEPSSQFGLKKRVDAYFRRQTTPHAIHLHPHSVEIIGDIPYKVLEKLVFQTRGLKKPQIEIIYE